ncbi:DNA-binding NarL/FixJ family response regulator [Flavobacterium sp. 28A]|uniref:response regulator transcription factor n=1 Tax=Flavobacterium sp. 28A TaxID=2735895 RepID=UPI0015708E41|nr:response regulator transcription factor [Flavobacterium sp. 28A]NRT17073.1 DNA-binding NarL/FixJ family response regulator [Flavobacterium sp. 28A]
MFTKVLIVDDIDFNDAGAKHVLTELGVPEIEFAKYCDEALLKIKKAANDGQPYELLISDLSFKDDHRDEKIKSGEELIAIVKQLYPEIKVIAFSIEDKSYPIKFLFEKFDINGYVIKGRNTMFELNKAILQVNSSEEKFVSPELTHIFQDKTINEIDNYDIQLIKYLSIGITQENMEFKFKELGITPNSKSTIEKRVNKLKIYFKANNPTHLVAIAKDLGLI